MFKPIHLLSLVFLVTCSDIRSSEQVRTFTNNNGAQIKATFKAFAPDNKVSIQRASDGKMFTIPIDTLQPDDQKYLQDLLDRPPMIEPLVKQTGRIRYVKISMPCPVQSGVDFGISYNRLNGTSEQRLMLPVGAWISVYTVPQVSSSGGVVQYRGESELKFSLERPGVLRLERDRGEPKIVALSYEKTIPNFDPNNLESIVSISVRVPTKYSRMNNIDEVQKVLDAFPNDVNAILSGSLDEETVMKLPKEKIVGFDGTMVLGDPNTLHKFDLRYLDYWGNPNIKPLKLDFPNLEQLQLMNAADIDWSMGTRRCPKLKHFQKGETASQSNDGIDLDFTHNPEMESISAMYGYLFTNSGLETLSKLCYLSPGYGTSFYEDQHFSRLLQLENIEYLYVKDKDMPGDLLGDWFESGNLNKLIGLGTNGDRTPLPNSTNCPNLKSINYTGKIKQTLLKEMPTGIVEAELIDVDKQALETLSRFPNLKKLKIRSSSFREIPEGSLMNLEKLILQSTRISHLHLDRLPKLRTLIISSHVAGGCSIQTLSGLDQHSYLKEFAIDTHSQDNDSSIGTITPIKHYSKLESIYLMGHKRMKSWVPFAQVSSLKWVYLDNCQNFAPIKTLTANSDPDFIKVYNCRGYKETTIGPTFPISQ